MASSRAVPKDVLRWIRVYSYKEPVSITIDSPDGHRTIDLPIQEPASER